MRIGIGLGLGFAPQPLPWRATDHAGCTLWLRGDLGRTIDSGLSVWEDQSGSGHDFVQVTGANQPAVVTAAAAYNGHDVIDFNGTTHKMACAGAAAALFPAACTIFIVCDEDAINTASATPYLNDAWLASSDANFALALKSTPISFVFRYFTPGGSVAATTAISLATPRLMTVECTGNGGALNVWKNGAGLQTGALANVDGPTGNAILGASYDGSKLVDGRSAEIITFSRAMPTDERQFIEQQLITRYALAA